MRQIENMVKWCINKAKKEGEKHRGLRKVEPSTKNASGHIEKAQHYLNATIYLKKGDYSDVAVTQAFYAMYHCLLAILAKFGYESRNQKCTFACAEYLIDQGKIDLHRQWLRKIASCDGKNAQEEDVITLREEFQYGRETKVNMDKLNEIINDAKEFIEVVREILVE